MKKCIFVLFLFFSNNFASCINKLSSPPKMIIDSVNIKNIRKYKVLITIYYSFQTMNDTSSKVLISSDLKDYYDTFKTLSNESKSVLTSKTNFHQLVPISIDSINSQHPKIFIISRRKRANLLKYNFHYGLLYNDSNNKENKTLGYITILLFKNKLISFDNQGIIYPFAGSLQN